MDRQFLNYLSVFFRAAAGSGMIWLALRFFIPWTAPIIVAFIIAAMLEPAIRRMVQAGWRRKYASAVLSLAVLAFLSFIIVFIASRALSSLSDILRDIPELMASALETLRQLHSALLEYTKSAPESVRQYVEYTADAIENSVYNIPAKLSGQAMSTVAAAVQATPDVLLFTVTAGIGSYFVSASYPNITAFIRRQFNEDTRRRADVLKSDLTVSFGGFMRAQLMLMCITFFELALLFFLLKIKSAVIIAALTAFVDALPVFGVGTVLIPWAGWCLLSGDYVRAVCLASAWGVISVVRSCIQAKLVGDQIGLDPVVSLLAIYTGWRIAGVFGMLIFPLIFVTVQQLNARGVIKLWK